MIHGGTSNSTSLPLEIELVFFIIENLFEWKNWVVLYITNWPVKTNSSTKAEMPQTLKENMFDVWNLEALLFRQEWSSKNH